MQYYSMEGQRRRGMIWEFRYHLCVNLPPPPGYASDPLKTCTYLIRKAHIAIFVSKSTHDNRSMTAQIIMWSHKKILKFFCSEMRCFDWIRKLLSWTIVGIGRVATPMFRCARKKGRQKRIVIISYERLPKIGIDFWSVERTLIRRLAHGER